MTMILMERMKKALSLALVLLMVFCSVSAVAEELDFVVLEAVDDYGEEAIQLVEMEIQTEEVGEPEQTIELIDLQEAEEPEIQEPEELMAESETIEIVQVTLEEPQEETPVTEESEPIQLTLDSQKRYGVAGLEPIAIDVAVAGGKEPVILTATVSLNGQTVSVEQIPEGTYSYLPWQGGQHTVTVTARDAAGSEVSAQATVPVSAGEYDLDAYNYWVGQLPQLSGSETFAERLLAAAESQVGYTESNDYFIIDSDGVRHGYTVYGDWAGRAYAQWDATFASFCLEGAGIPQEAVPQSGSSAQWVDKLGSRFVRRGSYRPKPGDLVFFTDTANGEANHVGIVRKTVDNDFTTIEGNLDKAVAIKEYSLGDPSILGFMKMEAVMEA
ncbi:MAG: CHAP domain-containing protein, partial [Clostridia bacterium]|nr:CHAP domain-containing protein [Clostridia bacterium]